MYTCNARLKSAKKDEEPLENGENESGFDFRVWALADAADTFLPCSPAAILPLSFSIGPLGVVVWICFGERVNYKDKIFCPLVCLSEFLYNDCGFA